MSTNLTDGKQCPNCGQPLPSGALAGLCPACLLAQGTVTDTHQGGAPHFQPPSLAEIAKLFPQLEILGLLGAGGMGAVYKARQPALDRFVALKILPTTNARGVNFAERFNREARALARLSHPNIVAVHEFGQAGSLHFFIMEFVDGANLRQLGHGSRLSPREALQIIPQICDALQYAHDEGVVHRDIKPENVLVDRKGRVKIADFGLAKILGYDAEAARLTAEGQIMGTPHYMAPEQVERPLAVDHRADIYSLGVVFYELLTGDLPLGKFPPPSRKVQVDVRLDEVVLRALENDPARRYQRASEVKSQVETIAGTPAPASTRSAPAQAEAENAPRPGVRYLRWAGIPVVVERDGEREVNFQGALTAVSVTMLVAAAALLLVRWLAGTEHSMSRLVWIAGAVTVVWGIRRTLNAPFDEEPQRAKNGTVVLVPRRRFPYLRDALMLVGLFAVVIGSHYFKTLVLARPAGGMKAALARQTAERDQHTGLLTVKLPGRGTVELLAVADVNAAPNQWWRPDGTPETNVTYELPNPIESSVSGRVSKDFLVRFTDLPNGAAYTGFSTDLASGASSGGVVFCDGQQLPGVVQVRTAFPPEAKRDNFRVALALEPWRTIGTQQGHSQASNQERKMTDPNWQVSFHAPTRNENGDARISYVFGPEDRLWTHRLIAVDTNGVEHAANSAQGTPIEKVTLWTCTFDRLPWTQVREYRLQVRPLHWVEFSNVMLQPNSPLPAPLPLKFSPVSERTLEELIDFDTGFTADFPPAKQGEPLFAGIGENVLWAQENGFDAAAGVGELQILDATFAQLKDDEWDTLTAQQVLDRHYQGNYKPRTLKPTGSDGSGRTFAYRTRENGFGVLQLVNLDPQQPGITVRFKQIMLAGTKPMVQARRDPQSGALVAKLSNGGSVGLLALRANQAASQVWLQADGTPATGFDCAINYSQRLSAVEANLFDLIFRLEKPPQPTHQPAFEFAGAIRSAAGGKVEGRDKVEDALLPVQVVWPLSAKSASARVGIPLAEWHTIRGFEPFSRSFSKTRIGDDPPWEMDMHTASVGTKGAQVTVVFGRDYPSWNLRVVAQRAGGAPVPGIVDATVKTGPMTTKTYVFPGFTLEEVQNFQVQAQPLEWVDFGDLNLATVAKTTQQ